MNASTWHASPPFGISDLEPDVADHYARSDPAFVMGDTLRCCIRGCSCMLLRRTRSQRAYCATHGISLSPTTFVHEDAAANLITGRELLDSVRKRENRLGNENSEDALTWNVLVGLMALGRLDEVFELLTGTAPATHPELYLWGNRILAGGCTPWERLSPARRNLDHNKSRPSELDAVILVPGSAIVVIEAKFRSPNSRYGKKAKSRGPIHQYLTAYPAVRGRSDPLNREWICSQDPDAILEQLCRNAVYAHWLAGPGERIHLVNLVSQDYEAGVEKEFRQHLNGEEITFSRATWEAVAGLPAINSKDGRIIARYLAEKTYNLRPAFPTLR